MKIKLLRKRNTNGSDYAKFKMKLTSKKEKLFGLGDINKWEITQQGYNKNELLNNREEAYKFMCGKVIFSIINYYYYILIIFKF